MSSPGETVNAVMQWLNERLNLHLPLLPFSGVWHRLTVLWERLILGPLPPPGLPLPWVIDVEGRWDDVIPGAPVSLENIRIVVTEQASPSSPEVPTPPEPPSRHKT